MSNTGTTPTATGVNYVLDERDHAIESAEVAGLSASIHFEDDIHRKVRDLLNKWRSQLIIYFLAVMYSIQGNDFFFVHSWATTCYLIR